jgi:3D (Asp-Asp-Asp) domain-containing protein
MTFLRRHSPILLLLVTLTACAKNTHPVSVPRTSSSAEPQTFTATAYCTGRVTSSGAPVSAGVAAADPKVLPIGTVIRIAGAAEYSGTYRVLDTGPRVRNRQVDLYIADCAAARRFGRRPVHVTVVRRGR